MVDTSARVSAFLLDACGRRRSALAVHHRCRLWAWILSHDNAGGEHAAVKAAPLPPLQDGLSLTTKASDYHSGVIQHSLWWLGCPASTPLADWRQSSWPVRAVDRPQVVVDDNLGLVAVEATRKLSHPSVRAIASTGFL
jgi:hypothetical protein